MHFNHTAVTSRYDAAQHKTNWTSNQRIQAENQNPRHMPAHAARMPITPSCFCSSDCTQQAAAVLDTRQRYTLFHCFAQVLSMRLSLITNGQYAGDPPFAS
jgi:hypothetical protein